MINKIAWKTYFVFFCFNIAFIPIIYFYFPETNGYKLETLDAIFAQAHAQKRNPVFMEHEYRKNGARLEQGVEEGVVASDADEKAEGIVSKIEADETEKRERI